MLRRLWANILIRLDNIITLFGTSGITDETDFGLAEIAVAPTYEEDFTNALSARGFNYTTVIADLAT